MTFRKQLFAFFPAMLAFACTPFSFADSSCANVGTPVNGLVKITCNFIYNQPTTHFDLFALMTQNGASLAANDFVTGYTVVINGDPATLADNATGLFNTSLWEAVLFKEPNDPNGPLFSDMLDVFWPGNFPSGSTVQSYNATIFGALPGFSDRAFFVQATGSQTVIGAGTNVVLNFFTAPSAAAVTPEPNPALLTGTGLLALAIWVGFRRSRNEILEH
jgi:hypothetical protein